MEPHTPNARDLQCLKCNTFMAAVEEREYKRDTEQWRRDDFSATPSSDK